MKGGISVSSRAWCYFVYLYHYLLIIGVKKVLCMLIPQSSGVNMFLIYILTVLLVLAIVSGVFVLMRKFLPRTTSVLLGGKV